MSVLGLSTLARHLGNYTVRSLGLIAQRAAHMPLSNQPSSPHTDHVISEIVGTVGFITLNRPAALNALSLGMIRSITAHLLAWRDDDAVQAVAMRGLSKSEAGPVPFGAFCAGGDIRFFHQAVLAGNPQLEDFFTEEYALNHLIHTFPKPTVAFMDGIVMGGGMGLSQGMSLRLVTERTKMAMPETQIGLFPDVGGGYFLSRCPGHLGEWLGLIGETVAPADAVAFGLADGLVESAQMPALWKALGELTQVNLQAIQNLVRPHLAAPKDHTRRARDLIDPVFSLATVPEIEQALSANASPWAQDTLALLHKRSPLMLHVTLAQIRRARGRSLADDLRMERNMVRHSFHPHHLGQTAVQSDTMEGIRAQAVDKDRLPKWHAKRIADITSVQVDPFFASPWPEAAHPLKGL